MLNKLQILNKLFSFYILFFLEKILKFVFTPFIQNKLFGIFEILIPLSVKKKLVNKSLVFRYRKRI